MDLKEGERIGWDLKMPSLDGLSPRYGWVKVDLQGLYHVHVVKGKRAPGRPPRGSHP